MRPLLLCMRAKEEIKETGDDRWGMRCNRAASVACGVNETKVTPGQLHQLTRAKALAQYKPVDCLELSRATPAGNVGDGLINFYDLAMGVVIYLET